MHAVDLESLVFPLSVQWSSPVVGNVTTLHHSSSRSDSVYMFALASLLTRCRGKHWECEIPRHSPRFLLQITVPATLIHSLQSYLPWSTPISLYLPDVTLECPSLKRKQSPRRISVSAIVVLTGGNIDLGRRRWTGCPLLCAMQCFAVSHSGVCPVVWGMWSALRVSQNNKWVHSSSKTKQSEIVVWRYEVKRSVRQDWES